MMEHFVTLFDSLFLPQGLALHKSMERHVGAYTLWILCVDDEAFEVLQRVNLPNTRLLRLSILETAALKRVKPTRSSGEYCWTITPFAPRFVFEADPAVARVTYVDADLWFRKSPSAIFKAFGASGKNVLITDHAFAPENDHSAVFGQYCVQFMTFENGGGETVRKWWEERCIEWCYSRVENGKFGDQKYLDDWPTRFERFVHVLERREWTQAPWNATRYPYSQGVFFHFHGLRITAGRRIDFGSYVLPKALVVNVYEPYIDDLKEAITILEKHGRAVIPQAKQLRMVNLAKRVLSGIFHQLWRFHSLNFRRY